MNTNMEIFLAVAQEMNLTRAAEKLFTTPQSLSYHIRQLEKEYDATFFNRTPRLSLTSAGERMLQMVQRISTIENALKSELKDHTAYYPSSISLMMPESRFPILAEKILSDFHAKYPNITLEIHGNPTTESEKKLLNGNCDIFIGLNPSNNPQFDVCEIEKEAAYSVGRKSTFQKHLPKILQNEENYKAEGIPLVEFKATPMILTHNSGALGQQIDSYLHFQQIPLNCFFRSNNADLHLQICQHSDTFCICPGMFLGLINPAEEDPLLSFPIRDFPYMASICVVRRKGLLHSKASDDLLNIIKSAILCTK